MTKEKMLEDAAKRYGWGKLGVAACCVLKHRRGIPDHEDFSATSKELEEFFASLSKRQIGLLCEMADDIDEVEGTRIH